MLCTWPLLLIPSWRKQNGITRTWCSSCALRSLLKEGRGKSLCDENVLSFPGACDVRTHYPNPNQYSTWAKQMKKQQSSILYWITIFEMSVCVCMYIYISKKYMYIAYCLWLAFQQHVAARGMLPFANTHHREWSEWVLAWQVLHRH